MPPPRHFVKRSFPLPASQHRSTDNTTVTQGGKNILPLHHDSGNTWILKLSGLHTAGKIESACFVYDLIWPILSGARGTNPTATSTAHPDDLPINDIKITDNGQSAFIIVSNRKKGDLIRDALHERYIGRGHRLDVHFSDRASLQSQLQNDMNGLLFANDSTNSVRTSVDSSTTNTAPDTAPDTASDTAAIACLNSLSSSLPTHLPFNGYTDANSHHNISVEYPPNIKSIQLINMVVENVLKYGPAFELSLMEEEQYNSDFEFLFNFDLPLHTYYRWKLMSLAKSLGLAKESGGITRASVSLNDWQTFQRQGTKFTVSMELYPGMHFKPPFPPGTIDTEIDGLQEKLDQGPDSSSISSSKTTRPFLGDIEILHLTVLLRYVSYERGSIARIMAFAIEHENAAEEVVDVICSSIEDNSASTQSRIARLWSIGDILANVDVASEYQILFRKRLVTSFKELREHIARLKQAKGRLSADLFSRQLNQLLENWRQLNIFMVTSSVELVDELEQILFPNDTAESGE